LPVIIKLLAVLRQWLSYVYVFERGAFLIKSDW